MDNPPKSAESIAVILTVTACSINTAKLGSGKSRTVY